MITLFKRRFILGGFPLFRRQFEGGWEDVLVRPLSTYTAFSVKLVQLLCPSHHCSHFSLWLDYNTLRGDVKPERRKGIAVRAFLFPPFWGTIDLHHRNDSSVIKGREYSCESCARTGRPEGAFQLWEALRVDLHHKCFYGWRRLRHRAAPEIEIVDEYGWIGDDEALDLVAIAQSAPGVVAANAAIILGYRMGGFRGTAVALFATVLPPLITLTVISYFTKPSKPTPTCA